MIRAIIIDDEQKGINSLKLLIEKFTDGVKVVAETTDARKGIELIGDFKPELVFLDIKMPHLNGFELLQRLAFRDFHLVFTTAHNEFGIQAIRNNALDYLLKPIDAKDLEAAINRAKAKQNEKLLPRLENLFMELNVPGQEKIPFHTRDKVEYISRNDIVRMESDSNYTVVHTVSGGRLMIAKTIGDYELILCNSSDTNFMRVHQSHIVNLKHVIRYLKDNGGIIVTVDNCNVPLSKNKKDDFTRWLQIR